MFFLYLFVFANLLSCGSVEDGKVQAISIADFHQLVTSGDDIYILDVRTEREYETSRLAATDIRIPYDSLSFYHNLLPEDSTTIIYCYCRSGLRSARAAEILLKLGYPNAINVEGGIQAWEAEGYPVISGP